MVRFWDELPCKKTGKLLRRLVIDLFHEKQEFMRRGERLNYLGGIKK